MNYQFKNNGLEYCRIHDVLDQYYAPFFGQSDFDKSDWKGPVRAQLELWALASRRARATIELTGQLATCNTPAKMMEAYSDYWRGSFADYLESTKRMASMFSMQPEARSTKRSNETAQPQPKVSLDNMVAQKPVYQNGSYGTHSTRVSAS